MRAIVFDFDGTLADSARHFADVYNGIAPRLGFRHMGPHERRALRKLSPRSRAERLGVPRWLLPGLSAVVLARYRQTSDEVRLFDGVPELIRDLHEIGVPLHIVSTKEVRNIRPALEREGIAHCFRSVRAGLKLLGKKRLLRRFLRQERLAPEEVLYVGDAPEDVEATRALGIRCVAVPWGMATEPELRARLPTQLATSREMLERLLRADALGA